MLIPLVAPFAPKELVLRAICASDMIQVAHDASLTEYFAFARVGPVAAEDVALVEKLLNDGAKQVLVKYDLVCCSCFGKRMTYTNTKKEYGTNEHISSVALWKRSSVCLWPCRQIAWLCESLRLRPLQRPPNSLPISNWRLSRAIFLVCVSPVAPRHSQT